MTKSIAKDDAETQAWHSYAHAKNTRDLLWEKLHNDFSLIQKGHEIDRFEDEWNEFSIAELVCRKAFDELQYIAEKSF